LDNLICSYAQKEVRVPALKVCKSLARLAAKQQTGIAPLGSYITAPGPSMARLINAARAIIYGLAHTKLPALSISMILYYKYLCNYLLFLCLVKGSQTTYRSHIKFVSLWQSKAWIKEEGNANHLCC